MRVAKNNFLVEVDSQFVQPKIKGFFIDTDFNPKLLSTKIGRIHSLSVGVYAPNRYDNPLSVGSEVVFGHLVCLDKNRVKDNVFMCPYHSIFAEIKNEELFPLEDILFCEPIKEADYVVGGYSIEGKVSGTRAKVFKVSKYADSVGVKVNDIVYFTKNADYGMDIMGKELYMMRVRNIIGIERDGELMTFGNKLLVKNRSPLNE